MQPSVELLFSFTFCPLINMPTRINKSSSTLIDNIFRNDLTDHNSSGILYSDVSDHLPIFIILPDETHKPEFGRETSYKCIFSAKNQDMFCNLIDEESWQNLIFVKKNPNTSYSLLIKWINSIYDKCFLLTKVKCKGISASKPWLTASLLNCCKDKQII